MLEQLRTLDKRRLDKFVSKADDAVMKLIDEALMISIGVKRERDIGAVVKKFIPHR